MKKFLSLLCLLIFFYACKPDKPEKQNLTVDKNVLNLAAAQNSTDSFVVQSNVSWTITIPSSVNWLQTSTRDNGNGTVVVRVIATQINVENGTRSAVLTINPANNSIAPVTVTVQQLSTNPLLSVNTNLLNISGIRSDSDSFLIQSNLDWSTASAVGWITLSETSGNGNKKIYVVNSEDNLTDVERTTTITVSPSGVAQVVPRTLTVRQKPWYRPFERSIINAGIKAADGNLVFAGITGFQGFDSWLLKTDTNGKMLWKKQLGINIQDYAMSIALAADGGYALAGYSETINVDSANHLGKEDIYVVKTDADGNKLWAKNFGGTWFDRAYCIAAAPDGGFIISGQGASNDGDFTGRGDKDLFVLKINSSGVKEWIRFYGGSNNEEGYAITPSGDGGYILAGYTTSYDGDVTGNSQHGMYAWVLKVDASGQLIWQTVLPDFQVTQAKAIVASGDGGFILAGYSYVSSATDKNLWIAKISANGTLSWKKNYGGSNVDEAFTIARVSNGFVIAGYTGSSDGDVSGYVAGRDIWVIRTDNNGNKLWQKTLGGTGDEEINSVIPLGSGTCILGGKTFSGKYNVSGADIMLDGLLLKIRE